MNTPYIITFILLITALILWFLYICGKTGPQKHEWTQLQVGSTCGFYAMAYTSLCLQKKNLSDVQRICGNIIPAAIENGDSKVGEIFEKDAFLKIWGKYYASDNLKSIKLCAKRITPQTIHKDLMQNKEKNIYYIVPVNGFIFRCPHYFVIWKENGELISWDGESGKRRCDINKLLKHRAKMLDSFKMSWYYIWHTNLFWLLLTNWLRNKKLFSYLWKQERRLKHNTDTADLILPIDLKGYAFRFSVDE